MPTQIPALSMNIKRVTVLWAYDRLSSAGLLHFASEALAEGYDSKSLRILAGVADPIMSDVGPSFLKALAELGISIPTYSEAGKQIALDYAAAIITGEISPYKGANRLWQICNDDKVEIHDELLIFAGLASEYEDAEIYFKNGDLEYEKYLTDLTGQIISEAKKFIEKYGA